MDNTSLNCRRMPALVFLSLLVWLSTAHGAPNITGIWEGQLDSKQHVKVTVTRDDAADMSETMDFPDLPGFSGSDSMAETGYNFKVKIIYDNNQARFINLAQGPQSNLLLYIDYATTCVHAFERRRLPPAPRQRDLPLSVQGVVNSDSASGQSPDGKYSYQVNSQTSFPIDNGNKTLRFKLHATINTTYREKDKNRHRELTIDVNVPLGRTPFAANAWADDEIRSLIQGAEQHPFLPLVSGFTAPLSTTIYWVFGDTKAAYEHVFGVAARACGLRTPFAWVMDMETTNYGYYRYSYLNRKRVGVGTLGLGKKAFNYNLLFLASSYVHEYTHYLQTRDDEWVPEKTDRENESHCVQRQWLSNNATVVTSSTYTQNAAIRFVEKLFNDVYSAPLDCSGRFPRARMLWGQGGPPAAQQPSGPTPGTAESDQEWKTIVD